MAARKTTSDVMRREIEKLETRIAKLTEARDLRIKNVNSEIEPLLMARKAELAALNDTLAKLEQKP